MARKSRAHILEVTLIADEPSQWEWQVCAGGDLIMSGYEPTREEARTEANSAVFLLLANGWKR
jgi:hypothetical protein